MAKQFRYGDKPSWQHAVDAVKALGGSATLEDVEMHLRRLFVDYKDNTGSNLHQCSVNSNSRTSHGDKAPRRTDDVTRERHKYDLLFKRGNIYELYEPDVHGVYEIYLNNEGKMLVRIVDDARQLRDDFDNAVKRSLESNSAARRKRLETAEKFPEFITATTIVRRRNPDVVAEVLCRANGICELCGKAAPFIRRIGGTPYLEVHHRVPLADSGEDSPENAIAACPNCHRHAHFG